MKCLDNSNLNPMLKSSIKKSINRIKSLKDLAEINELIDKKINEDSNKTVIDQDVKIDDLIEDYKKHLQASGKSKVTIENYVYEAFKVADYIKANNINLISLSKKDIEKYLALQREERNLKENAYSKLVTVIRVFLKFLKENKYIILSASEILIPKTVETIREYLQEDEIIKIFSYLNQRKENYRNENLRDLLIIHLGIDCGLRKSEILNLKWEDIDFTNSMIYIRVSKGGKSRKVPFNADIKRLFLNYRKKTKQYIGKVIKGSFGKKITSCALQNIVVGIYKKSGVYREGLCIHSLRHSYAERLRKKGTDIVTIAKLLGHSRIDTTQTYFHVTEDDIKNAVL
ncbi:MAG: hypothetical protein FJW56_06365 [Actinobacteria bacterium]|nr:hypothetical protein [Actinomycetota bacterium]